MKVMCVRHRDGWCALAPGAKLDPMAWEDETACGHVVMLRIGSECRKPTCTDCIRAMSEPARKVQS